MKRINIRELSTVLSAVTALLGVALVAAAAPASARPAPTPKPSAVAASTPLVFDINGSYTDGGSARPVISDVNDILTVDMSSQHRPNASGIVINSGASAVSQTPAISAETATAVNFRDCVIALPTLKR